MRPMLLRLPLLLIIVLASVGRAVASAETPTATVSASTAPGDLGLGSTGPRTIRTLDDSTAGANGGTGPADTGSSGRDTSLDWLYITAGIAVGLCCLHRLFLSCQKVYRRRVLEQPSRYKYDGVEEDIMLNIDLEEGVPPSQDFRVGSGRAVRDNL